MDPQPEHGELAEAGQSFLRRRIVRPVLRLLGSGVTPERLSWSLAVGVAVGLSPTFGVTTVVMIVLAWVFRLNQAASQIGMHAMGLLQVMLLLPFLQAGAALFHTAGVPFSRDELLAMSRHNPLTLLRQVWLWEWHALVVWVLVAVVFTPLLAWLLSKLLTRVLQHRFRHAPHVAAPESDGS